MYLFNLKLFVCSNLTILLQLQVILVMYRSLQYSELRLLIKRLKRHSVCGLYTNTPTCWQHNEVEIFHNEIGFHLVHYSNFSFILSPARGLYVNKHLIPVINP